MAAKQYREKFDLPASVPLASVSYCKQARRKTNERIETGSMNYDHLPLAVDEAKKSGRGFIASASRQARSEAAKRARPGDHSMLPPGSKRADGRDADRARETQRKRRMRKAS
jgi:hypothetical protein